MTQYANGAMSRYDSARPGTSLADNTPVGTRHVLRVHYHLEGSGYDPELYGSLLEQLHGITPRVQAIPPTDADCDITGALRYFSCGPHELAQLIQMRVTALHGVGTTLGSAGNRMLAAMAVDTTAPGGITHLSSEPEAIASFLRPRQVGALYGVGPAMAGLLARHGLHTIGAVADTAPGTLQRLLGRTQGRLLHERAHGLDTRPVTPQAPSRSYRADHAFLRDELDPDRHRRAVLALVEELGIRLRSEHQITRRLTLTMRYADGSTTTRTRTLPESTSHGIALVRVAYDLYETFGLQRARVRGIAVRAEELQPIEDEITQLTFDPADDRARRIEISADRARARFGPGAVRAATLADV
ncbi:DNA polymerase Y family protein [Streptomyces albipurpureus]|uniref:DNA polymerase Y-family little finger domain-containing protein n=1 Tax=Streptomyces albipurpureus TaxID=2897419 RepID=A0ABT0US04_9ACTN|nr:hypothetical protein [Streptomyces sp. CWNU-1]MCM2391408.1 hypothetical protein [Streptomyces sp. CWNU-1]